MDNTTRRDNGLAYITDEAVWNEMLVNRKLVQEFNNTDCCDRDRLRELANQILGKAGKNCCITQPFHCDYGKHIFVGDNFYTNYNCVILDVATVEIGNNVLFAPNVAVYTAGHPVHPESRNSGYEYGAPIKIGNNVWVGGNTVILPGVTIGDNCVIGAGSVVTKDIPSNTISAGNPCKVIREITAEDKKFYFKDLQFDDEAWAKINSKD